MSTTRLWRHVHQKLWAPVTLGIAPVWKPVGVGVPHGLSTRLAPGIRITGPCVTRFGVVAQMRLSFPFLLRFSVLCQVLHHVCFLPTPTYSAEHKNPQCWEHQESPGLSSQLQPHPKPPPLLCPPLETPSSAAAAQTNHKGQSKR